MIKLGFVSAVVADQSFEATVEAKLLRDRLDQGSLDARKASLVQSHTYIRQFVAAG